MDAVSSTSSEDITEIQSESVNDVDSPAQLLFSPPSSGIPSIYTTPAPGTPHKLSVIEEASDVMSRVRNLFTFWSSSVWIL